MEQCFCQPDNRGYLFVGRYSFVLLYLWHILWNDNLMYLFILIASNKELALTTLQFFICIGEFLLSFQRFYGPCKFILFWWKLDFHVFFFLLSVDNIVMESFLTNHSTTNQFHNKWNISLLDISEFPKNHQNFVRWKIRCQDLRTLWFFFMKLNLEFANWKWKWKTTFIASEKS